MKNILVADNRANLLATLGPILKHWGYRVLSVRQADQVMAFITESDPCLLIVGEELLADPALELAPATVARIVSGELPLIALRQGAGTALGVTPSETLEVPVELFELFSFIQRKVEHHPRHNLRLRLKLPGMYSIGNDSFILAEVLSLSTHGLFFKAATRVKKGDHISVVFPLFGHCKEIEVESTVLYVIQPEPGNNYFQGFGVSFDNISESHKQQLQLFIREHFLREVSAHQDGVGDFSEEQLKS